MHTAMFYEHIWRPPPVDLVLPDDEVHVWRASLDLAVASVRRLQGALTADELNRAARCHAPGSRNRFIAARGLLREILGRYLGTAPDQRHFWYNRYGKPSLAATPGQDTLIFNLSHSHGLALYAVARGSELGVDLERIRMESGWERMARRCLSASEHAALYALPAYMRCAGFFAYWTCKEAYLKAIGAGLLRPPSQVEVRFQPDGLAMVLCAGAHGGERWSLHALAPGPGYAGALVVEGHGRRLRCWQWPAHPDCY